MRRRICRLELLKLGAKLRLQRGRGRGRRWRRFGILCGGPGKGGGCGLVFLFFFGGFFWAAAAAAGGGEGRTGGDYHRPA